MSPHRVQDGVYSKPMLRKLYGCGHSWMETLELGFYLEFQKDPDGGDI